MSERQAIILCAQGGRGDVLASTSAVRAFRNKYPKDEFELVIVTPHPEMYFNNPNVDNLLSMSVREDMEEVYNKYIYGDTKIRFYKSFFLYDFFHDEVKKQSKTLPEFICRLYNIEYDGDPLDYYISDYERHGAESFLKQFSKPVILLHITGTLPLKSVPPRVVQGFVNKYKNSYDFVQVGAASGEPVLEGVHNAMGLPVRHTAAIMEHMRVCVVIESLFGHLAGALKLSNTIVIYQSTDPKFFGHPNNYAVFDTGNCPTPFCNSPVGSRNRYLPAFLDLKTAQPLPYLCPNQVCNKLKTEDLEKVFLEVIAASDEKEKQKAESGPFEDLAAAQRAR